MSKVVFAGGGTGGHLYPGLAVADRLRSAGNEVCFIGTRRGVEARVVPNCGYPIHFVRARGLSSRPIPLLKALAETFVGFLQSVKLFLGCKPDLVVGTGGYVSAPAVLAAAMVGVPVVVLEQNAVPGKATRFLARLADQVCLSFPESASLLSGDKVVVTGNPVRPELMNCERGAARRQLELDSDRPTLLITGASQGASSLNKATMKALVRWRDNPWTVLHLTGASQHEQVAREAAPLVEGGQLDYRPIAYLDDIGSAYASADLVVSRAGATTIAELTCLGLPAILVPYPFAGGHQTQNAEAMARAGGAILVADEKIEEELTGLVEGLFREPEKLEQMRGASARLGEPEALNRIAGICETLAKTGRTRQ